MVESRTDKGVADNIDGAGVADDADVADVDPDTAGDAASRDPFAADDPGAASDVAGDGASDGAASSRPLPPPEPRLPSSLPAGRATDGTGRNRSVDHGCDGPQTKRMRLISRGRRSPPYCSTWERRASGSDSSASVGSDRRLSATCHHADHTITRDATAARDCSTGTKATAPADEEDDEAMVEDDELWIPTASDGGSRDGESKGPRVGEPETRNTPLPPSGESGDVSERRLWYTGPPSAGGLKDVPDSADPNRSRRTRPRPRLASSSSGASPSSSPSPPARASRRFRSRRRS